MASSRLASDQWGRTVAVVTTSTDDGLPIGHVFVVVDWRGFFTPLGRPPTAREIATTRVPYGASNMKLARRERQEIPDDQLDDEAAIRAAYLEQRREPVDLLSAA